jgi:ribonuclease HII
VLYYERKFRRLGFDTIIGVDEAGRGPLAGPVVAAAVALKAKGFRSRIDDSKKLTPRQREAAFLEISAKSAFGIGIVNEQVIDRVNILQATRLAMLQAVGSLIKKFGASGARPCLIVDGNMPLDAGFPCQPIVGGDGRSKSIAAASILAKVSRDRIMSIYDRVYPGYGFLRHKGYPTSAHRRALKKLGPSPIHRKSFCLLND